MSQKKSILFKTTVQYGFIADFLWVMGDFGFWITIGNT